MEKGRQGGFTFISALVLVAVVASAIWLSLVLSDILLKTKMVRSTTEEMGELSEALVAFYRDVDVFPYDSGNDGVDLKDLEEPPPVTRFPSPNILLSTWRANHWDGPYIHDKYDDDGYLRDAWGTVYRYTYDNSSDYCTITSAGPDRAFGTSDDISIRVSATRVKEEKIKNTREELALINAKAMELISRYNKAGRSLPLDFGIDDLFQTYGASTTGLVAWWKMDEEEWTGALGEVKDSSGNGNDGTAFGGATTHQFGKLGRCGKFDGNNDYIALPMSYGRGEISETTVCAWVKSSSSARQIIISFDRSEVWRLALEDDVTNNNVGWDTTDENNVIHDLGTTRNYNDGEWHFICGWFDNNSIPTKKIYVDGQEVRSATAHFGRSLGAGQERTRTYGFIGVGSEASSFNGSKGPYYWFNGYIDEVRIWERALSSDEIFYEFLRGIYLTDRAYYYDEWEMPYQWDSARGEFYSCGPDRTPGTPDDIYQY